MTVETGRKPLKDLRTLSTFELQRFKVTLGIKVVFGDKSSEPYLKGVSRTLARREYSERMARAESTGQVDANRERMFPKR